MIVEVQSFTRENNVLIKPKPRMLFVDDSTKRIHAALAQYSAAFDVTIATNVPEALRLLSRQDWDIISLDHDLGGCDYIDPNLPTSGMEIIRYIEKTGWPEKKPLPKWRIHSSNVFAAKLMVDRLNANAGPDKVEAVPFVYLPKHPKQFQVGLVTGAFDVIHPGYIYLFRDAKSKCETLVVALNVDPSVEHPGKLQPILSVDERTKILLAIRYVDRVMTYKTEADLESLITNLKPDARFLGNEYINHPITAEKAGGKIVYHVRRHDWSTTKFKKLIYESVKSQVEPKKGK